MSFLRADAFSLLARAHQAGRLAHAWLIIGSDASGARQLAEDVTALILGVKTGDSLWKHPDAHRIEPESKSRIIRIEQIRDVEVQLHLRSNRGGAKVAVIFDADRLTESAANAFLKTLEEPSPGTHMLLVTSQPDAMKDTILSRCLEVTLREPEHTALEGPEASLLQNLRAFSKTGRADLPAVFSLVASFGAALGEAREKIEAEIEPRMKADISLLKEQRADSDVIEAREEFYKALIAGRTLRERGRLLNVLQNWFSDALRAASGAPVVSMPDYAADIAAFASRYPVAELLERSDALDALRANFSRNVSEQLAIECALLKAFGNS